MRGHGRHAVRAVLLTDDSHHTSAIRPPSGSSDRSLGTVRTDRTLVDTGLKAGSRLVLWQDGSGMLATAPPSTREAALEAGVLGALASTVHAAGAVARWRLDRRRVEAWGREWDLVGPRWGHRTS
ncbi:hypothetical protein [Streptomyces pseudovenezuelae]|uniref:Uncharacterized protein n=1 Tax=Streptomyces pseudovenezuelae TaxID=67350 RepID=A0ABZ1WNG1_9ACTN|nr:hypothetical protein [Streptomyces pseudovenezuelae]